MPNSGRDMLDRAALVHRCDCPAVAAKPTPGRPAATAGCAPGHQGGRSAGGAPSASATGPSRSNAVGVSPGGVTTRVDAPADSSEEEYGQAGRAAKMWMDQRGGDPQQLVEPYLATLQAPGVAPGLGTFNTPWAQLTPTRQAAVIVAARAAAGNQCG